MSEFGTEDSVKDEDFMIHVLNNLPEEYDVVMDGLENQLMLTGPDVLIIKVICDELNQCTKK